MWRKVGNTVIWLQKLHSQAVYSKPRLTHDGCIENEGGKR